MTGLGFRPDRLSEHKISCCDVSARPSNRTRILGLASARPAGSALRTRLAVHLGWRQGLDPLSLQVEKAEEMSHSTTASTRQ